MIIRVLGFWAVMGWWSLGFSAGATTWPARVEDPFKPTQSVAAQQTMMMTLHDVDVSSLMKTLQQSPHMLLSDDATVIVQSAAHRVWVRDDAQHLKGLRALFKQLDQPRQALLLKARIVSVDDQTARDLGVLFQTTAARGAQEARSSSAQNTFVFPIANLHDGHLLDVKLNLLEKAGLARMVSAPEMMTLNHQSAEIEAGEEVPYQQETANGGTSVAFKKAVMKLKITPHLLSNGRIQLNVQINQDKVSALTVQGVPAIHTQALTTQVVLRNRQTVAIGGIYETHQSNQHVGLPVLKELPVVGGLFRSHSIRRDRRQLLIYITADTALNPPLRFHGKLR